MTGRHQRRPGAGYRHREDVTEIQRRITWPSPRSSLRRCKVRVLPASFAGQRSQSRNPKGAR